MRIAIIVNEQRKDSPLLDKAVLDEAAAKHDLTYDLLYFKHDEIQTTIQNVLSQSYNGLLVGGGDGTVRAAVQLFLDQTIPVAILPLGTFNIFAKELNYPTDTDSIFAMLKNNKTKLIDVGEVNDHVFLNHSSVGFYARIMKMRKKHPALQAKNKLLKILFTAFHSFKPLTLYNINLDMEKTRVAHKVCLLVVGNNQHSTDMISPSEKVKFTMGHLEILTVDCQTRWQLFKCVLLMFIAKSENNKYVSKYYAEKLAVTSDMTSISVVIDGDLFKLNIPLSYSINHKKLLVFTP